MHLVIYGAGDKGKWAVRRYQDYISRAKEFVIVDGDKNKQGKGILDVTGKGFGDFNPIKNYIIESPDILHTIGKENMVVIVACDKYYSGAGAEIGNLLIDKYGLKENEEFYFLDKLNNSMELHMSSTSTPFSWLHGF